MLNGLLKIKRYKNIVTIESEKDALIIGAKEGIEYAKIYMDQPTPRQSMRIVIQKERSFISAVLRSTQYSKMGLFNIFTQCDEFC